MKNKQFFILIILLVIGFASISATLIINGNTKVAANIDDFNVIFIEGFLDGEESPNVEIDSTKKTLTFTTNILTNINDTARVDYKVKNISTQYDGDVTVNCTNETNEYVSVTSSFDGHNLPLTTSINMQAQEVKTGYINAELTKATTEDQEVKITCKIEVSATSRTNYAYSLSFDSNGGTNVEDKIVEYNSNYGELSVPEKEGYTFIGWFNENDVRVDENTIFDTKGNRNLHAKWAETAYPIEIKKIYADKTETETINIPYGESIDTLLTVGEEYYISNIECDSGYTIENYNKEELIFGEQTIRINNNHIANSSTCTVTIPQGIFTYSYTGAEQKFVAQASGNYKVELWGAQGGGNTTSGFGGYVTGNIVLTNQTSLFVYVGNKPELTEPPYNGGGTTNNSHYPSYNGGGSTDVRKKDGDWDDFDSLKSRIIVAGAGGGYQACFEGSQGGSAGGLNGYDGTYTTNYSSYSFPRGASQITGGLGDKLAAIGADGVFGKGGNGDFVYGGGAGGGGYYGGGGGGNGHHVSSGAGGSSFISGHNGCDAISKDSTSSKIIHTSQPNHYSEYVFTDTIMVDGAGYKWTNVKGSYTGMPTHDGTSTMTGNTGDGYAKITYLGK